MTRLFVRRDFDVVVAVPCSLSQRDGRVSGTYKVLRCIAHDCGCCWRSFARGRLLCRANSPRALRPFHPRQAVFPHSLISARLSAQGTPPWRSPLSPPPLVARRYDDKAFEISWVEQQRSLLHRGKKREPSSRWRRQHRAHAHVRRPLAQMRRVRVLQRPPSHLHHAQAENVSRCIGPNHQRSGEPAGGALIDCMTLSSPARALCVKSRVHVDDVSSSGAR